MKKSLDEAILLEMKAIRLLLERLAPPETKEVTKEVEVDQQDVNNSNDKSYSSIDCELYELITNCSDLDWSQDENKIAASAFLKIMKRYNSMLRVDYGATGPIVFKRIKRIVHKMIKEEEPYFGCFKNNATMKKMLNEFTSKNLLTLKRNFDYEDA